MKASAFLKDYRRILDAMLVEREKVVEVCVESGLLPLDCAVTPVTL